MAVGAKIIDIRVDTAQSDLVADIKTGLRPKDDGEKTLPTLLLYSEAGLKLFEKITYLDEAIDRLGKDVQYYAVDLSLPELERTFSQIPIAYHISHPPRTADKVIDGYKHVKCYGLFGTYDNALDWLKSPSIKSKPKTILWLGSSLGNFKRHEVSPFLAGFGEAIQSGDTMLIGIDSCKDADRVYHAYNDRENVTHEFIINGLRHANELMDETAFNTEDWKVIGEYDQEAGRHHAFVSPRKDVVIDGVRIPQGERVRIEESYKYSPDEILQLWEGATLAANSVWTNTKGDYGLHLVSKPVVFFPTKPLEYAPKPAPSFAEWQQLWATWDAVTRQMIPEDELLSKPINLRNACIFYLGHIPTFLDIHLARSTDEGPSDPAFFWKIFERGIDPDVEDPTKCHDHSEIPEEWPPLVDILEHQQTVRKRAEALYASGKVESNTRVTRAMWLGFEHEAMHLETLLYMLIQSERVLPPPGTGTPDFEALAKQSATVAVENQWFTIPEAKIDVGLDDPENDVITQRHFGWDNERPRRSVEVKSFRAKARPITNGEYATYLSRTGKTAIPASWSEHAYSNDKAVPASKRDSVMNGHTNGTNGAPQKLTDGKFVRTVYGTVPLQLALDWPVMASYDELSGCAQWMGGRIPTMEEARSIYSYVDSLKAPLIEKSLNTIPAVNGHLINNGVDESPPSKPLSNGASSAASGLNSHDLFIDLEGTNVGFKHWHPISVTDKGGKLCGQSDLGGVWEWTSTVLEKHEKFEPMALYPGYTADFFDGKHNVTLGGSWATHPRLAGRKTFVNCRPQLLQEKHQPQITCPHRPLIDSRQYTQPQTIADDQAIIAASVIALLAILEHVLPASAHILVRIIAEGIRDVYESCGEVDWNIIPSESEERGRTREYDASPAEDGEAGRPGSEETPASKRERKDAKCLARAASRSRVISQDEIVYVDSVIHSSDGTSGADGDGPCNSEEMEEVDRHLRYNAQIYNEGDRRTLRKFARLPDVDVDFDAGIERVLEAFRISELLQRNTRNRGLQGKELKIFQAHVHHLKKTVVEDLVSVKRDTLETRMRRAGYLRYTNKTAQSIIEDRYTDKDWKTGERLSSNLRHLEKTHLRVTGDDGLGQKVIEPYHAPLLPMSADRTSRKPAVQLRVVTHKPTSLNSTPTASSHKKPRAVENGVWQTVLSTKKPASPSVKPDWGMTASGRAVVVPPPPTNPWGPDACEIPDLRSLRVAAVQPADAATVTASTGPDRFVDTADATVKEPATGHPAVNQKKAKKYEREARRKAKKAFVHEEDVAPITDTAEVSKAELTSTAVRPTVQAMDSDVEMKKAVAALFQPAAASVEIKAEVVKTVAPATLKPKPTPAAASPPTTQNGKHMHWIKFKRQFIVDQLSDPCLPTWSGCSHDTSCPYEANGVPDCPFHEPHCSCVDPLLDECYLVYPCDEFLSCGPFNRLRGEKLFNLYQKEEHFKERIMLVDNDLLTYFVSDPIVRMHTRDSSAVPKRLAIEYADFTDGYNPGPLMEQEKQFERLWSKNNIIKRKLSRESLSDVQQKFEAKGIPSMCYCNDKIPENGLPRDVVECAHRNCTTKYFHKSCVKKLGVDKVTRWFCTMCEEHVRGLTYRTLRDLGFDDVPTDDEELRTSMEKIRKRFKASSAEMDRLQARVLTLGSGKKMAGIVAMAIDTMGRL
ncbi:hypothetical protein CC86DRAFT_286753 [Ophiobolus disseminans]|uniref:Uncharacterized protein n=1 Tax=Ophiobolus disseminans TaxID=1469910 RepID=A0A6A7A8J6_9PLEO|nr:hypothetical protein CC86DRAFT_286753 [Ophiobolus disseminans]